MSEILKNQARGNKLQEQIFRELSKQFCSLIRDQRLKKTIISQVLVSKSLTHAKVYVHFGDNIQDSGEIKDTLKILDKASGFLRSNLAKKLRLYRPPKLKFIYDDSMDKAKKLAKIFNTLEKKTNKDE